MSDARNLRAALAGHARLSSVHAPTEPEPLSDAETMRALWDLYQDAGTEEQRIHAWFIELADAPGERECRSRLARHAEQVSRLLGYRFSSGVLDEGAWCGRCGLPATADTLVTCDHRDPDWCCHVDCTPPLADMGYHDRLGDLTAEAWLARALARWRAHLPRV